MRFIHLTFCEFLGALEAIHGKEDGWKKLLSTHHEFIDTTRMGLAARLTEVLPFAAALMPRHLRGGAISDLADAGYHGILSRAFLETKVYDHPAWPAFISSRAQSILDSIDSEWSPEWLREVHLFMVVCTDAERVATLLPKIDVGISLTSFFEQLADRSDNAVERMIGNYAEQDAAAAFRVASLCKIDMAERLPDVAIANADQPPFMALLLERAASEPDQSLMWSRVLSEAGLRSPAVAYALYSDTSEFWRLQVQAVGNHKRWFLNKYVHQSLFTQCLSIACQSGGIDQKIFPLLAKMQLVTPPGKRIIDSIILRILSPLRYVAIISFLSSSLMLIINLITLPAYTQIEISLKIIALCSLMFVIITYPIVKIIKCRRSPYMRLFYGGSYYYFHDLSIFLEVTISMVRLTLRNLPYSSRVIDSSRENQLSSCERISLSRDDFTHILELLENPLRRPG